VSPPTRGALEDEEKQLRVIEIKGCRRRRRRRRRRCRRCCLPSLSPR